MTAGAIAAGLGVPQNRKTVDDPFPVPLSHASELRGRHGAAILVESPQCAGGPGRMVALRGYGYKPDGVNGPLVTQIPRICRLCAVNKVINSMAFFHTHLAAFQRFSG